MPFMLIYHHLTLLWYEKLAINLSILALRQTDSRICIVVEALDEWKSDKTGVKINRVKWSEKLPPFISCIAILHFCTNKYRHTVCDSETLRDRSILNMYALIHQKKDYKNMNINVKRKKLYNDRRQFFLYKKLHAFHAKNSYYRKSSKWSNIIL